jgi:hypothetical protein
MFLIKWYSVLLIVCHKYGFLCIYPAGFSSDFVKWFIYICINLRKFTDIISSNNVMASFLSFFVHRFQMCLIFSLHARFFKYIFLIFYLCNYFHIYAGWCILLSTIQLFKLLSNIEGLVNFSYCTFNSIIYLNVLCIIHFWKFCHLFITVFSISVKILIKVKYESLSLPGSSPLIKKLFCQLKMYIWYIKAVNLLGQ